MSRSFAFPFSRPQANTDLCYRPIPQAGGSWGAEDPRPQETYGQGATGLEQDLQGGLDAMHR